MLYGVTPFYHQSAYRMSLNKKSTAPLYHPQKIPRSKQVKDLLTKLLKSEERERLGWKQGLKEIMNHPWFYNENPGDHKLEWESMQREAFRIVVQDPTDLSLLVKEEDAEQLTCTIFSYSLGEPIQHKDQTRLVIKKSG